MKGAHGGHMQTTSPSLSFEAVISIESGFCLSTEPVEPTLRTAPGLRPGLCAQGSLPHGALVSNDLPEGRGEAKRSSGEAKRVSSQLGCEAQAGAVHPF